MPGLHPTLAQAAATLRARDPALADDAEGALGWLVGDEGPAASPRTPSSTSSWYQLPVKWLTGHDHHRQVAAALGEVLDLLDLPRYAAICRSPLTAGVLDAYEHSAARGRAAFHRACDASVVTPPDLPEFQWGSMVGPQEARALSATADFLELAAASGTLVPGRRGWKGEREQMVRAHLTLARQELGGASWLDTIQVERLEDWLQIRDRGRVWPALLADLAPTLSHPAAPPPGPADDPLPPLRWLLERLAGGQALTATGNLNLALVREAASHFGWWDDAVVGPPYWEDDVVLLRCLHNLAGRLKALRRRGKGLTLSPRGRALLADPDALWRATARHLFPLHEFPAAVGEVTLALLAVAGRMGEPDLRTQAAAAMADHGWRDSRTGAPPDSPRRRGRSGRDPLPPGSAPRPQGLPRSRRRRTHSGGRGGRPRGPPRPRHRAAVALRALSPGEPQETAQRRAPHLLHEVAGTVHDARTPPTRRGAAPPCSPPRWRHRPGPCPPPAGGAGPRAARRGSGPAGGRPAAPPPGRSRRSG